MSEIVYSREAVTLTEGQVYQNPRFFSGAVAGVSRVTVHGDWPEVVAAYTAVGAEVEVIATDVVVTPQPEPAPGDFGPLAAAFITVNDTPVHVGYVVGADDQAPRRTRKPR